MKNWKFWLVICFSLSIIVAFQNCAGDFNQAEYLTSASPGEESIPDSAAPIITNQLTPATIVVGQTTAFSVFAEGTNLQYQWSKDGQNIADASENSYIVTNAQFVSAGLYGFGR